MTPTPAQIAEWREEFESKHKPKPHTITRYVGGAYQLDYIEDMWTGYLRARTEQATEIAELKAKVKHLQKVAAIQHEFEEICEFDIKCGLTPDCLRTWLSKVMPLAKVSDPVDYYTHPAPFVPITADMVTDEMIHRFHSMLHTASHSKFLIVAAVNAWGGK